MTDLSAALQPQRSSPMLLDGIYYRILEQAPRLRTPARGIAQYGAFALARGWRRNLMFNAGLALGPESSRLARARCALGMLGSMQRFICEVFASQHEAPDELRKRVSRFEGTEHYLAARRFRRGVVLAGIHMGSFEPALATLGGIERRVHVLFHPDASPRFERARNRLRGRLGVVEHPVTDGLAAWSALQDALRADEAVLIHADRTMPGQTGIGMPFLGLKCAQLPPGPLRLAASCGAPIVPTFCARTPRGLHVWADSCIETEPSRLAASDIASHPAQQALVAAMERAIRAYPNQWMAFSDLRCGAKGTVRA